MVPLLSPPLLELGWPKSTEAPRKALWLTAVLPEVGEGEGEPKKQWAEKADAATTPVTGTNFEAMATARMILKRDQPRE
jgi:hypothetical protein